MAIPYMQRSLFNLFNEPGNRAFPLLSVRREGEPLCETKELYSKPDKLLVVCVMKNEHLAVLGVYFS